MKRIIPALLCVLVLSLPAPGVPDAMMYECDNCGTYGPAVENASEPGFREDGRYGQWIVYTCSGCGEPLAQIERAWRELDPPATAAPDPTAAPVLTPTPAPVPTAVPALTPTPVPAWTAPPAVTPEQPVTVPPAGPGQDETPSGTPEPAIILPDGLPTPDGQTDVPVTMPPVLPPSSETAAEDPGTGSPQNGSPAVLPSWNDSGSVFFGTDRRNTVRYPYFSAAYPSRRLNLPGDPEARAPVPGERIWPAEGVPSILQQILNGD